VVTRDPPNLSFRVLIAPVLGACLTSHSWPQLLAIDYLLAVSGHQYLVLTACRTLHGLHRKRWLHGFSIVVSVLQQFIHCRARVRCRGNVFTEPMLSSGHLLWLNYSGFQHTCHNIILRPSALVTYSLYLICCLSFTCSYKTSIHTS
jgi:hypothetical protein